MGLQQSYYAKQVGQSKVRVAEKAFLSLQMAHEGTAGGRLLLVSQATCYLLCSEESGESLH